MATVAADAVPPTAASSAKSISEPRARHDGRQHPRQRLVWWYDGHARAIGSSGRWRCAKQRNQWSIPGGVKQRPWRLFTHIFSLFHFFDFIQIGQVPSFCVPDGHLLGLARAFCYCSHANIVLVRLCFAFTSCNCFTIPISAKLFSSTNEKCRSQAGVHVMVYDR